MQKQRTWIRTLIGCALALLAGLPGYAQDETAARHDVWETVQAYSAASAARDLDRYLSYWHADFIGWHNGGETPQAPPGDAAPPLDLRVDQVKIKVTDVEAALVFYRDVLGFAMLADAPYPERLALEGGSLPLVLEHAAQHSPAHYPHVAQTKLSLESYDLAATMKRLKARGVTFLHDPSRPYGQNQAGVPLGLATRFRDPFGHEYSIVEQQLRRGEAFTGIRVYNTGFYVSDVEKARAFYAGTLGFTVLTDQYYPNIPLGHADSSFAFMLHEHPQMENAEIAYPDDAKLLIVFTTGDLETTMTALQAKGVALLHDAPQQGPEGRYVAFKDPFGNVAEVLERRMEGSR